MKKLIALILAIVTVFSLSISLASCQKKQLAEFVLPENGYDGSEVEITFYHTMGKNLTDVLGPAIERFNEIFPNIKINHDQVGSYDDVRTTISSEISVQAQPNIAYCYPDHVALYNLANAVIKLDDLIASTIPVSQTGGVLGFTAEEIADFIPGYYNEGKQFDEAGTMYTLPMSKSTEVLYYNKTFFDQHNLELPKTWEDMGKLCEKILEIDPDCVPLGYDSEANWFITMCEQLGSPYTSATGEKFIFDDEKNYEFCEMLREWYEKDYFTTQDISKGYTSELFKAEKEGVQKSYMSIGSSAGATHQRPTKVDNAYPFDVGITTIPQFNPEQPKVISQGPSLCIFNQADPQEVVASWLFVKFLTTDVRFQAEFSIASGYVPVIKSVMENPVFAEQLEKADGGDFISSLSAKVCLEQADAYYTSPAFNGSSTARDEVGLLLQNCIVQPIPAGLTARQHIENLFALSIEECEYQYPSEG